MALTELRITNLGVIADAQVPLGDGLTVITGETGAGKTMLLTGLDLLMGGKADPAMIRTGATSAAVEGRWVVDGRDALVARIDDAGADRDDDGSVLAARTVSPGRSRAFLGGRSVPAAVLADVGRELVTIHGQSDQLRLRSPARQLAALDAYAGADHQQVLARHREQFELVRALQRDVTERRHHASVRRREAESLRHGLAAIERVAPEPGEDRQCAATIARLSNVEHLRLAVTEGLGSLTEDALAGVPTPGATSLLDQARRAVERAAGMDLELGSLSQRLTDAFFIVSDIAGDLAAYHDALDADPAALEAALERQAQLTTLTRLYGDTIDDVLAWESDASLRLLDLDNDQSLARLEARIDQGQADLDTTATTLRRTRIHAARRLAAAVTDELAGLAMKGARFGVAVTDAEPSATGNDAVTFSLAAHADAPDRPLAKGASGGELSRVMLAIEVALAGARDHADPLPTFVFDEVDAGVGGRAAGEVGRRLAQLAKATQVVVVTHLAQVAAFADHHLVVTKKGHETSVVTATGEARIEELARMLSGSPNSATAKLHATELRTAAIMGR